jgi:hypothetical protein
VGGSFDTFTQAFSDWVNGYTGTLGTTAPNESVALQMTSYNSPSGVVHQDVDLYGYVFSLNPGKTVQYLELPNDSNIQVLAIDEVYQPEQVDLAEGVDNAAPAFNAVAITMNSATNVPGAAGIGAGYSLSANALGSTLNWNGQTFEFGPASASNSYSNVISGSGNGPILLPQGHYTSVQILASASYGPVAHTWYVQYTNGTTDSFTVNVSDWMGGYDGTGGTTAAGESIALTMTSYNADENNGNTAGTVYLYGYVLPTNPSLVVQDIEPYNDSKVKVLAIDVVDQPEQVNLGDAANSASPAFNAVAITMNSLTNVPGAQGIGGGESLSANALGTTVNWNGQTFDVGPASSTTAVPNVVMASGNPPIVLPQGQYTSIQFLAAASDGPASGTWYVDYTNGTYATFNFDVSDWWSGYNGTGGTTSAGESIALTMSSYNADTNNGNTAKTVYLYGYVLPTNPSLVVQDLRAPNNNLVKIIAIDTVSQEPQVNLGNISDSSTPYVNVIATTVNSSTGVSGGGLDGSNDTYSANALASSAAGSPSTPAWDGQTFDLAPADAYNNNAVQANGQTINLPEGWYTGIQLLGTATGGSPQTGTFTVDYVGGGTATFPQTLSDWQKGYTGTGGTTAPGESIAATMSSYDKSSGNTSGTVYLYGYVFPLNPAEEVESITFPNDSDIKVLAIDEVAHPPQVNLAAATASASPPASTIAFTFNAGTGGTNGGLDGSNDTYSLNALAGAGQSASAVVWNSQTFNLGQADSPSAVPADGQTIALPEGYYTSIQLLGTATGGSPVSGTFQVNYVGGTYTQFTQTFSDWQKGYTGTGGTTAPGESIAATMTSYNKAAGNTSGNVYLYGYVFAVNPAQLVSSITLPSGTNSTDIKVLAVDVVFQPPQATFVKTDTSTEGNWIGVYGAQGYNIIGSGSSYPSYAIVTPAGTTTTIWSTDPTSQSALETPGGGGRIAAAWYNSTSFTVDVDLTDGQAHDLALYFDDYNGSNERSEQVQISDVTTGSVLYTQTVSDFSNGTYLQWVITGNVLITITRLAGTNAVLNGLFFDAPSASATFVKEDTTTGGNWIGSYGSQGYQIPELTPSLPSYATVALSGNATYEWSSSNPPALELPGNPTSRIASCWDSSTSFTITVDLTDGRTHDLALYALDYDNQSRAEQIQISSAGGTVLNTQSISHFTEGIYLQWVVSGDVVITVTCTGGINGLVTGIFFDPPTVSSPLVKAPSRAPGGTGGGSGPEQSPTPVAGIDQRAARHVSIPQQNPTNAAALATQVPGAPGVSGAAAVDALLEQDELITLSLALPANRQSRIASIGLPALP